MPEPAEQHCCVAVEHGPSGPAQARAAVAGFVRDVGVERLADDLVLIVSELVTNAVRYGAPPVRLEVDADDDAVTVTVVDAAPARPVRRPVSTSAEGGRGLLLIDLLAAEAGVRSEPPGKAVWAAVRR